MDNHLLQRRRSILHRGHLRPGVAMLMVLAAVAIVFVVGLGLVSSLPAAARTTGNLLDRDRAVYLAESGLTEALHRLEHPPDGDTWTGVSGRSIAGLDGTYDVLIEETDDDVYLITATGRATGRDGRSMTHRVSSTVRVEAGGGGGNFTMDATIMAGGNITIPRGARIEGDLSVAGDVTNFGTVKGTIAAIGTIDDQGQSEGSLPPQGSIEMPKVSLGEMLNYEYEGETYSARKINGRATRRLGGNYDPVSDDNPLGVVVVLGTAILRDDVKIKRGILVVNGDLYLNGHSLKINGADEGRVALYTQDLFFTRRGSELVVKGGPAYITQRLVSGGFSSDSKLRADSGLMISQGTAGDFNGDFKVRYQALDAAGGSLGVHVGGVGGGGGGQATHTVIVTDYNASP